MHARGCARTTRTCRRLLRRRPRSFPLVSASSTPTPAATARKLQRVATEYRGISDRALAATLFQRRCAIETAGPRKQSWGKRFHSFRMGTNRGLVPNAPPAQFPQGVRPEHHNTAQEQVERKRGAAERDSNPSQISIEGPRPWARKRRAGRVNPTCWNAGKARPGQRQ